jgi:lipopolysaccharide biosynthesis glycosyltransferase
MKNIIFIPAYNGFDKEYSECIESWKYYAKKWDIQLIIANEERQYEFEVWGNGVFERWVDNRLVQLEYDRILMVDSDTMVRWDAPNIFEIGKDYEMCVVADAGGANTGRYHLNQWVELNQDIKTPADKYFNMGCALLSKQKYLQIREHMPKYYEYWSSFYKVGPTGPNACEQTPVNIISYELFPNEIYHLNWEWNNMVMCKYDDASFINDSYIWHFTGPRMGGHGNKKKIIKEIWEYVKQYYVYNFSF